MLKSACLLRCEASLTTRSTSELSPSISLLIFSSSSCCSINFLYTTLSLLDPSPFPCVILCYFFLYAYSYPSYFCFYLLTVSYCKQDFWLVRLIGFCYCNNNFNTKHLKTGFQFVHHLLNIQDKNN